MSEHPLKAVLESLAEQIERTPNNGKRRRLRAELARTVAKVERRAEMAELRRRKTAALTPMRPPVARDVAPLEAAVLLMAPRHGVWIDEPQSGKREDMAWAISERQRRFLHPDDPDARTEEVTR